MSFVSFILDRLPQAVDREHFIGWNGPPGSNVAKTSIPPRSGRAGRVWFAYDWHANAGVCAPLDDLRWSTPCDQADLQRRQVPAPSRPRSDLMVSLSGGRV